jgi:hypothetical protein
MKIKTATKFHFYPVKMVIIQKPKVTSGSRDVKIEEFLHIFSGNVN